MSETDKINDWNTVRAALIRVGEHLRKPTRLVLIGSSVAMWYGQPGRMTEDVDVWSPKSQLDLADIQQACQKAGIVFDPKDDDVGGMGLYIQMLTPGVVHVGKWKTEHEMFRSGNLEVVHPPAENVIASKLVRAEPYDIEDVAFLMHRLNVSIEQVRAVVDTLPEAARERASENMVFLQLQKATLGAVDQVASRPAPAAPGAEAPRARRARP